MSRAAFEPVEDEAGLIEEAKRDRAAFAVLYRRHYALIAGYVYRRVGDGHATEDLVAEVFLTALRYLPRYQHRGTPVKVWLYRIATTTVNRWARRERRRLQLLYERYVNVQSVAAPSASVHDADGTRLAMLTLNPKFQAVLALHYLEGLAVEEVAGAIGCRVGTVKSRLSRGREALRKALESRRA